MAAAVVLNFMMSLVAGAVVAFLCNRTAKSTIIASDEGDGI